MSPRWMEAARSLRHVRLSMLSPREGGRGVTDSGDYAIKRLINPQGLVSDRTRLCFFITLIRALLSAARCITAPCVFLCMFTPRPPTKRHTIVGRD